LNHTCSKLINGSTDSILAQFPQKTLVKYFHPAVGPRAR